MTPGLLQPVPGERPRAQPGWWLFLSRPCVRRPSLALPETVRLGMRSAGPGAEVALPSWPLQAAVTAVAVGPARLRRPAFAIQREALPLLRQAGRLAVRQARPKLFRRRRGVRRPNVALPRKAGVGTPSADRVPGAALRWWRQQSVTAAAADPAWLRQPLLAAQREAWVPQKVVRQPAFLSPPPWAAGVVPTLPRRFALPQSPVRDARERSPAPPLSPRPPTMAAAARRVQAAVPGMRPQQRGRFGAYPPGWIAPRWATD